MGTALKTPAATLPRLRVIALLVGTVGGLSLGAGGASFGASTPSPIAIYQSPLTVAIPAHPQVLLAVANSESMDGNLSGAIMAGSGSLSGVNELQSTSSPLNYVVPAGFTPPVSGGAVGSSQPYTSTVSGNLVDNSPSRMNVAKAGLTTILNNFMQNTDFALMSYQTSGLTLASTWVYYMSAAGANFSVASTVPAGSRGVANPCYNIGTGTDTIQSECAALSAKVTNITSQPWLIIGASSDDPSINDVLYDWSGGISPLCMVYTGPSPANPYPPNFSLGNYESGSVLEKYSSAINSCATITGPTNAGYVPYSPQVMYVKRGFGYYTSGETSNNGLMLVNMTSVGTNPTATTVTTAINKFLPYFAPETNSTGTKEIKAAGTQSPMAGILTGALTYLNTVSSSSNGCKPTKYVVLITDGLPTRDLSGNNWPPLGSTSAAGYGVTASFNSDGSLNTTNDQALTDTISSLAALNTAGIKTYIIGMGAGVDKTANPTAAATMTAMAVAGGTGSYFPATDPATVASDLQVILAAIQAGTQSVATAAVNSTSIHTGSVVYQGQFSTSDDNQDWSGNLYAFPIDVTTGNVNTSPSAALWGAQAKLDGQDPNTGRTIATWDTVANKGIPFRWTTGTPTSGIASSTAMGTALSGSVYDSSGSDALSYIRGVQSLAYNNGGPYRARAHLLGDVVDSAPLYVAGAGGNFSTTSYASFSATIASRMPVIYVGANDGMLHAISASSGNELFAYIPRGVYNNLLALTDRYYSGNHKFFVDGSPVAADVAFGTTWHTILAGGENGGGNSIYALDITNPASLNTESALAAAVLWDFTDANMGLTYSRPAIAPTNAGAAVMFGNGYNSTAQTPYFYALNAQTGAVLAKINLCAQVTGVCNSSTPNGLSSVTVTNINGDLSGNATLAYAGDLQGNVWRINMTNANPTLWTVSVLFQARDSSSNAQPITTAPAVSLNPSYPRLLGEMVYVGTGQMLSVADLSTTSIQTMYGIYDNNNGVPPALTRGSLIQQTLSNVTVNLTDGTTRAGRTITSNAVSLSAKSGWYVDLSLNPGERVVTDPVVDSGDVIVTTNQPTGNLCAGGVNAWLNLFNYATGGSFPTPQLSITTQTIEGLSLGQVYAASPRVEIYDHNATSRAILVTESAPGNGANSPPVPIQDFTMYGRSLHRTSWTELR